MPVSEETQKLAAEVLRLRQLVDELLAGDRPRNQDVFYRVMNVNPEGRVYAGAIVKRLSTALSDLARLRDEYEKGPDEAWIERAEVKWERVDVPEGSDG